MVFAFLKKHKVIVISGFLFSLVSCHSSPGGSKQSAGKLNEASAGNSGGDAITIIETGAVKVHFTPSPGSTWYYTITNETNIGLEAGGKKVRNQNRSEVGITYDIQKDSAGNLLLHMRYDKIHIHAKNGDKETEFDAANAAATLDPTEKMLGLLKEANIVATVNKAGKVVAISGYKELGEKILSRFNADANSRNMAESQWEKVVGEGLIKKNVEQLFSIYPDSSIRIGDTWEKNMQQKGELNMNVASTFKLKDIDDGVAFIESEGEMTSDKGASNLMGYSVTSNLQGDQEGEYEVDTKTGMLLKNKVTAKIEGSFQLMGKDIPVTIKTSVKMDGKKIK